MRTRFNWVQVRTWSNFLPTLTSHLRQFPLELSPYELPIWELSGDHAPSAGNFGSCGVLETEADTSKLCSSHGPRDACSGTRGSSSLWNDGILRSEVGLFECVGNVSRGPRPVGEVDRVLFGEPLRETRFVESELAK